jgi:4-diphosphocytidyl-2C-methyl-D-erythritol kinase
MIVDNPYPNLALVAKYETWMDGTMVRLDEEQNIPANIGHAGGSSDAG